MLSKNTLYYEHCPPFVSRQSILEDMERLPPGKERKDKYYIGFYQAGRLIAVMDLIDGYPEAEIAYIGFFMTERSLQGNGIGTEHFWLKNGFVPFRETTSQTADEVILAERVLSSCLSLNRNKYGG